MHPRVQESPVAVSSEVPSVPFPQTLVSVLFRYSAARGIGGVEAGIQSELESGAFRAGDGNGRGSGQGRIRSWRVSTKGQSGGANRTAGVNGGRDAQRIGRSRGERGWRTERATAKRNSKKKNTFHYIKDGRVAMGLHPISSGLDVKFQATEY